MDRKSTSFWFRAFLVSVISYSPSAFAQNEATEAGLIRLWASPHNDSANIQTIRNGDNISPPALHRFMTMHLQDTSSKTKNTSSNIQSVIAYNLADVVKNSNYTRVDCNNYLCEIVVVFKKLPKKNGLEEKILDRITKTLMMSKTRQYRQFSIGKGPGPNGYDGVSIFAYISI